MTAPDQVLTDLLAAHEGGYDTMDDPICKCGWYGDLHAAHVALVVKQHTQTQTAELAKLKRGANTLGELHTKTLKWVIEASNSEDLINDDGDGDWEIVWDRLFQLRPELDAATARAEKAEAANARVATLADDLVKLKRGGFTTTNAAVADRIRAALEGEQR